MVRIAIALFSDEILMRYLYAILCTMFHRNGLYRVQFLFRLIGQIKIHFGSPLREIPTPTIILHSYPSVNALPNAFQIPS